VEATPFYLLGPTVASRVREITPDSKIIAIFRNPVERFFSACVPALLSPPSPLLLACLYAVRVCVAPTMHL
jgi:hypothetical protein